MKVRESVLAVVALVLVTAGCSAPEAQEQTATVEEASASSASEATANGKTLDLPIVTRSIAFHGGDVYQHSQIDFVIASKSGAFKVEAWNDGGLFDYRVHKGPPGEGTTWRHTNRDGSDVLERTEAGQPLVLDDEARAAVQTAVASRIYFPFLPLRLNDGNTWKEDQGLETWDGRELQRVKVTFTAGTSERSDDAYAYWFDPETARLEAFAYSFSGGLRYRPLVNYRRVGGVLFFDQPNYALDGSGLSVDQITPEFVASEMKLLSTVVLEDIEVTPNAS